MCAHLSRTLVTKAFVRSVKLVPGTRCTRIFLGAKGVWRVQQYLGCGLSALGGWYRMNSFFFTQALCGLSVKLPGSQNHLV